MPHWRRLHVPEPGALRQPRMVREPGYSESACNLNPPQTVSLNQMCWLNRWTQGGNGTVTAFYRCEPPVRPPSSIAWISRLLIGHCLLSGLRRRRAWATRTTRRLRATRRWVTRVSHAANAWRCSITDWATAAGERAAGDVDALVESFLGLRGRSTYSVRLTMPLQQVPQQRGDSLGRGHPAAHPLLPGECWIVLVLIPCRLLRP